MNYAESLRIAEQELNDLYRQAAPDYNEIRDKEDEVSWLYSQVKEEQKDYLEKVWEARFK